MAVAQNQITIPSNGTLVTIFGGGIANSNQLSLRNTGTVTVLIGPQSYINPPLSFTATAVGSGGTFAAGTYYWKVTATNSLGESTGSLETTQTLVNNGSCNLQWAQVTGATGYKVYRATSSGGESTTPALVTTIGSGSTVTYTDTGTAVSSGAVPASNTAAVPVLFPLAANEYLGVQVLGDDVLLAQVQTAGTAGQLTTLSIG